MHRNYLRGLLICLIPCLAAGAFAFQFHKYRLGIDLAGGTILVYEVNLERTKQRKAELGQGIGAPQSRSNSTAGLSSEEMNQLAAQIKRRIDPTDIKNVTVRPLGDNRIEIILPTSGAAGAGKSNMSVEDIEEVKRLISQMGVLEFRILANGPDDGDGIIAAKELIEKRKSSDEAGVTARAVAGLAPEGPDGDFNVDIGESKAKVRYVWAELGPSEREQLGMNNANLTGSGSLAYTLTQPQNLGNAVMLNGKSITEDPHTCQMMVLARRSVSRDEQNRITSGEERLKREGKSQEEIEKLLNPKQYEYFILTRISPEDSLRVGGDITVTATSGNDRNFNPAVEFMFNTSGAQLFSKITRRNKPSNNVTRYLAIILDDKVVSAPSIKDEIGRQGIIEGKFTRKEVDRLVQIFRSGALSAELREKPVSENTIGPTLGRDTIHRGETAVALAFVAILIFMVIYYRFAGIVACVALFANLLLTVGFMVAVNAAFTLPGLAGLVLTLGMAVDANVLIYERLREERNKGANLITAIRNGYDRAFPTIIDTHLTSIFTAIVLYTLGNDNLKGFAISLTVGLVISLFTSLYVTRLIFDYWQHRKWLKELRMMRLFEKPNFRPMNYRYIFFSLTGALTVLGLVLFLVRGEAGLNVDFRGGTVFAGKLKPEEERALTTTSDGKKGFRELLDEENQKKRLDVKEAIWENKPASGSAATVNVFIYKLVYADGTTATVSLSQKPDGNTPEEMAANVKERASQLPDVSVEQMFLTGQSFAEGKSQYFTIRTTEKQPELVRASLERLFRDDATGQSLMAGAVMSFDETKVKAEGKDITVPLVTAGKVTLNFTAPTSRSYVQELLDREFRTSFRQEGGVEQFILKGDGQPDADGRYVKMELNVGANAAFDQLSAEKPDPTAKAQQSELLQRILAGTKKSFDSTPEPVRLEVFDSQLASETRDKAMVAILASWLAILAYLWFRFLNWTFGLAAVLCLIHDLCFTLGAIALCHYLHLLPGFDWVGIQDFKIDLAAVAALLTLVGYSVSDTIVVFDRIREVRGKNPKLTKEMIDDSVNQTLSRTILTATTVFLVSIVLYAFGGEGVHLFAFVMVMGVLVGTYSSVFVAAPLLLIFGEGREDSATYAPEETSEGEVRGSAQEEVVEG